MTATDCYASSLKWDRDNQGPPPKSLVMAHLRHLWRFKYEKVVSRVPLMALQKGNEYKSMYDEDPEYLPESTICHLSNIKLRRGSDALYFSDSVHDIKWGDNTIDSIIITGECI